ncbi:MAG: phosphotriesterase-related protein, partial [Chloroflexota bacterium]
MPTVNSVLGPIDTAALGFTLMHEHVVAASAGIVENYPEMLGTGFMEHIVAELKALKKGGIDTVVDATTVDLGRKVTLLADVARLSGVNIIACTGWWLDTPRFFPRLSANQLADSFIREIKEGIVGTNIKAGILKGASDM